MPHASRLLVRLRRVRCVLTLLVAVACTPACGPARSNDTASIEITKVPVASAGGPDQLDRIEGRVSNATAGQRVVLFAKGAGKWWVQPLANEPFTAVGADATWSNWTHLGSEYAAVLVGPDYRPPDTLVDLPAIGGGVLGVATVDGARPNSADVPRLSFAGYDWEIRTLASDRAGTRNTFAAANAWTDARGSLHLKITGHPGSWSCAEVKLARSLGYGSYVFVVRDVAHLEPSAVLTLFTREDGGDDPNGREMDVEFGRWGDPASKNAQFVVQPFYVPSNVVRFDAPPGPIVCAMRWEPGRVAFSAAAGTALGPKTPAVAEHTFSSGVPSAGGETVRLNLYVFGNATNPLRDEAEVVVERFEYLP
jgi:hypothetical protein